MKEIYTDGGSRGNPGPGGWGVVVAENNKVIDTFHDQCAKTTNNQEELKGLIRGLEYCRDNPGDMFTVYVDSAYAIGCISKWAQGWENNGWTRPGGKEIKNLELVKKGYYLYKTLSNCDIQKVKGHSGVFGNELADELTKY